MKGINAHVYPSPFKNESRILKETKSLADAGLVSRILIVATWEEGLPERESLDARRDVVRLKTFFPQGGGGLKKILGHAEWTLRALLHLLLLDGDLRAVTSHSLSVLPIGFVVKALRQGALIYDAHELETETLRSKGIRRLLSKALERTLIRFVDRLIVVSPSILEWYRKRFPWIDATLVRNLPTAPARTETIDVKGKFSIPKEAPLFLYAGLLAEGRGILEILDAFRAAGTGHHVVFIGYGPLQTVVEEAAAAESNVHFHPAVPQSDLPGFIAGADVGLCPVEPVCLSYRYALPNKLFECLMAGVPVIASPLPDMADVIETTGAGWLAEPSSGEFRRLIGSLTPEQIQAKKEAAKAAAPSLLWEREAPRLLEAYAAVLN